MPDFLSKTDNLDLQLLSPDWKAKNFLEEANEQPFWHNSRAKIEKPALCLSQMDMFSSPALQVV